MTRYEPLDCVAREAEKITQMDRQMSETFINATLQELEMQSSEGKTHLPVDELIAYFDRRIPGATDLFFMKVALGRLQIARDRNGNTMEFSPWTLLFLCSIAPNVGTAVMWAYFLVENGRNNHAPVSMASLSGMFPVGFPTEEALHERWDAQKGYILAKQQGLPEDDPLHRIDNWLDTNDAWAPYGGAEEETETQEEKEEEA